MAIVSDVVILARTKMNDNRVCIGGYSLQEKRYVRLLMRENTKQLGIRFSRRALFSQNINHLKSMPETESYHIGEIYTIEYENRTDITLPHCEDVIVLHSNFKEPTNYNDFLNFLSRITITNIHIRDLFDGLLQWENKRGFLVENQNFPTNSVIVVQLSHDLFLSRYDSCYYYYIDNDVQKTFEVKYVGVYDNNHLRKIPADTYLRFSLARWWDGSGSFPTKRAYLQLSAIY